MVKKVGILALQGNYIQHKKVLDGMDVKNILVKYPLELKECNLLIIPGGESTAISKQLERNNLRLPILEFSQYNSIFGVCAGMILLSSTKASDNLKPMGIMDYHVERNAYGRQLNSFVDEVQLDIDSTKSFNGIFIRAPKFSKLNNKMKILATYQNYPVMVSDGRHFASTFDPEIGSDYRIHNYILNQVNA